MRPLWTLTLGNTEHKEPFEAVEDLAFSPDGTSILVCGSIVDEDVVVGPGDHWDATWLVSASGDADGEVEAGNRVCWAPAGTRFAAAAPLRIWDRSGAGRPVCQGNLEREAGVRALAWSPRGDMLAADRPSVAKGENRSPLALFDPDSGSLLAGVGGADGVPSSVAFSPDGGRLVALFADGSLCIWELGQTEAPISRAEGVFERPLRRHCERGRVLWSPDGVRLLTVGNGDPVVRLWRASDLTQLGELRGHAAPVNDACWSPDGQLVASAGCDNTWRIWSARTHKELQLTRSKEPRLLSWAPQGDRLAAVCHEYAPRYCFSLVAWNIAALAKRRRAAPKPVTPPGLRWHSIAPAEASQQVAICLTPNGRSVLTALGDGSLSRWSVRSGRRHWRRQQATRVASSWIDELVPSIDGSRIAGSERGGHLQIWDTRGGNALLAIDAPRPGGHFHALQWAPDGSAISATFLGQYARPKILFVFDSRTGATRWSLDEERWTGAVWSPDSRHIAIAGYEETRLCDAASGAVVTRFEASFPAKLHWSPDAAYLALLADSWIAVVDPYRGTRRWQQAIAFTGNGCLDWSPDGRRIAVIVGRTIQIRSSADGQLARTCAGHDDQLNDLRWSGGGAHLVSAGKDQRIRVWAPDTGACVAELVYPEGQPLRLATATRAPIIAANPARDAFPVWDLGELVLSE